MPDMMPTSCKTIKNGGFEEEKTKRIKHTHTHKKKLIVINWGKK